MKPAFGKARANRRLYDVENSAAREPASVANYPTAICLDLNSLHQDTAELNKISIAIWDTLRLSSHRSALRGITASRLECLVAASKEQGGQ
jgi:hypothetical protein